MNRSVRAAILALTPPLLMAGGWDLGGKIADSVLDAGECARDWAPCGGRTVTLSYVDVLGAGDAAGPPVLRLRSQGVDYEVVGWPGPLPAPSPWLRVSLEGLWTGERRISATRVIVSPFAGLKAQAGILALMGWIGVLLRWSRRRGRPAGGAIRLG